MNVCETVTLKSGGCKMTVTIPDLPNKPGFTETAFYSQPSGTVMTAIIRTDALIKWAPELERCSAGNHNYYPVFNDIAVGPKSKPIITKRYLGDVCSKCGDRIKIKSDAFPGE